VIIDIQKKKRFFYQLEFKQYAHIDIKLNSYIISNKIKFKFDLLVLDN